MTTMLYASAARTYLAAGYSPLPLPPGQKWPPPKGWTGAGAPMAHPEQVSRWIRSDPGGNIALRLPEDVIGIDLDLYPDPSKDHPAVERLAAWDALVSSLGPLLFFLQPGHHVAAAVVDAPTGAVPAWPFAAVAQPAKGVDAAAGNLCDLGQQQQVVRVRDGLAVHGLPPCVTSLWSIHNINEYTMTATMTPFGCSVSV